MSSRSTKRDGERPEATEPLPHPVVDNHCHLDIGVGDDFAVEQALSMAAEAGIPRLVQVGVDLASSRWSVDAAHRFDNVVAGVALHPNDAPRLDDLSSALAEIRDLASDERVRVIGETGLDYFRTDESGREAQHRSFREHIAIAQDLGKTLMIHDREAHDDVLKVLDQAGYPDRWVMHCFSGDAAFAEACLERGAYLSFSGTVTFKNAEGLREALRITPQDRVLVETDAPFLTPMPFRGRPNASYLIPLTMRSMAQTRGDDLEELCRAVEANTFAAFGGAWGGPSGE